MCHTKCPLCYDEIIAFAVFFTLTDWIGLIYHCTVDPCKAMFFQQSKYILPEMKTYAKESNLWKFYQFSSRLKLKMIPFPVFMSVDIFHEFW